MRTFAQKPKATQQTTSAKSAIPDRAHFGRSREVNSILHLQRTIGNQAVLRTSQTNAEEPKAGLAGTATPRFEHDFSRIPIHPPTAGAIQTKLAINKPEDIYEQEADRVAEQVMHTAGLRTSVSDDQDQARNSITRKQNAEPSVDAVTNALSVPPIVHDVLNGSGGQPFDVTTRAFMEPRFGHDFSHVRVHIDSKAAESVRGSRGGGRPLPEPDRGYMEGRFGADFSAVRLHDDARANSAAAAIGARAFTAGSDIVFGAGQYAAGTPHGRHLLAHELAHVVQQGSAESDRVRREPGLQPVHISPVRDRPIQRQPQDVAQPAAMPGHSPLSYGTLPLYVQSICDEQAFNNWVADPKDGPGVRVTLIGIYRLMEKIGFNWGKVPEVKWVGTGGLLLTPGEPLEAFREHLLSIGFKDVWLAKRPKDIWGLRRTVGAIGLHIRAERDDKVEFHIDLHPPKWWALFGLWHVIMDLWARRSTHTPAKLAEALHLENEL